MRTIPLTRGYVTLVDDEDFALASRYTWHAHVNRAGNIYAYSGQRSPNRKILHRLLLGITDAKLEVDHINGDGLDNRRHNLRIATRPQNARNQKLRRDSTTYFKGVYKETRNPPLEKPYRAYVNADGVRRRLGYFKTAQEAAYARDIAAKALHGEFWRAA